MKRMIEHQVGGARNATGEAERDDRQHRLVDVAAVAPQQLFAKFGRSKVGGVDHRVGAVGAAAR